MDNNRSQNWFYWSKIKSMDKMGGDWKKSLTFFWLLLLFLLALLNQPVYEYEREREREYVAHRYKQQHNVKPLQQSPKRHYRHERARAPAHTAACNTHAL